MRVSCAEHCEQKHELYAVSSRPYCTNQRFGQAGESFATAVLCYYLSARMNFSVTLPPLQAVKWWICGNPWQDGGEWPISFMLACSKPFSSSPRNRIQDVPSLDLILCSPLEDVRLQNKTVGKRAKVVNLIIAQWTENLNMRWNLPDLLEAGNDNHSVL